jgi:hypothetical protein
MASIARAFRAGAALLFTAATWTPAAAADPDPPSSTTPPPTFANYGFASELGSGVYSIDGRTVQIYQIPLKFNLRVASPQQARPGLDLLVPVTVGFFNFQTTDVTRLKVPTQVGEMSVEPGVQLDYRFTDMWHLYPYVKGGGTFTSSSSSDALIYDMGLRSDYRFLGEAGSGLYRADFTHAGVHYTAQVPAGISRNDSFTRLRDAVEWRRSIAWTIGVRHVEISPYGIMDIYIDPPSASALGIARRAVQLETGVMFGVAPMWQIYGITLPRIGIGYRVAGEFSGWKLSIGDPF